MKKTVSSLLTAALAWSVLTGCSAEEVDSSAEATQENPMVLRLAHNLNDTHVTSQALTAFAEEVTQSSDGRIVVDIYANGQLGSETQVLGQLTQGIIDMTRVSSPGLADYDQGYETFGLPYVFGNEEEYYQAMDSPEMQEYFQSTEDEGFVGLTYYTSGARSFYTADTPIREPEDLSGLKIRVQDMRSQTELLDTLGGTPVVMAFGDIYTALQTGMIDGAESNETALTQSNHGEVAKVFSVSEHTRIPDMLVISADAWERLSPEDQQLLVDAAAESTESHKVAWAESIDEAIAKAKEMGVTFITDVDIEAFQREAQPLVDEYAAEYPEVAELLQVIESAGEAK
ncbi:TRAP transporter substrate-binding protein [Kocuria sp. CPCC 205300]|uniref:TRAP transporter substrate-binding protein n=1 Tax=Kocuria sabuli TaxID=3071448 RepID=UPI0036DEE568